MMEKSSDDFSYTVISIRTNSVVSLNPSARTRYIVFFKGITRMDSPEPMYFVFRPSRYHTHSDPGRKIPLLILIMAVSPRHINPGLEIFSGAELLVSAGGLSVFFP